MTSKETRQSVRSFKLQYHPTFLFFFHFPLFFVPFKISIMIYSILTKSKKWRPKHVSGGPDLRELLGFCKFSTHKWQKSFKSNKQNVIIFKNWLIWSISKKEKTEVATKLKNTTTKVIATLLCADFWPSIAPGLSSVIFGKIIIIGSV